MRIYHMAQEDNFRYIVRVANTDLDGEKTILQALRKIRGVSFMMANALCVVTKMNPQTKAGTLSDEQLQQLQHALLNPQESRIPSWLYNRRKDYETGADMHVSVNDLFIVQEDDVKRLKKVRAYRGIRHANKLPSRGQRTKSNFRKNKGKR